MPPVTRRETGTQDSTAALSSADSNLFHEEVDRAAIRLGPTEHNRAPALTRQYSDLFLNDHAEHTRSSKRSEDTQHRVTAGMAYVDQVGVETECVVQNVRWERQRYSKGEPDFWGDTVLQAAANALKTHRPKLVPKIVEHFSPDHVSGMACALRGLQKATTGPISSCVASQAGGTAESLRAGLEYSVGAKIPKILDFMDDGGLTRNMTCAYLGTDEYGDATFTFNAVNGGEQSAAGGQATGTVNISPRIDGSWLVSPMRMEYTAPTLSTNMKEHQSNCLSFAYQLDRGAQRSLSLLEGVPPILKRTFIDKLTDNLPELTRLSRISGSKPNEVGWDVKRGMTGDGEQHVTIRLHNKDEDPEGRHPVRLRFRPVVKGGIWDAAVDVSTAADNVISDIGSDSGWRELR